MADIFGGIPRDAPISDDKVTVDSPKETEYLKESDIPTLGGEADYEEIPIVGEEEPTPTRSAREGKAKDLGSSVEGEPGAAPFQFQKEVWNVDETMSLIGKDGLDQMILTLNNYTRRFVEKNMNKRPRRDLSVDQIRAVKISEQIIKTMHHYAPSLPYDSPTTGLCICALTLCLMNLTSPLIPENELEKTDDN